MATRRLTDAFLLMRNNAIQNRQILAEQVSTYDPRRALSTRSNAAVSLTLIVWIVLTFVVCVRVLFS